MEKQELLQQFTTQFEQYAKVRGFIEKAKSQSSKFRPEVIEKVCLTHEIKSMELAETVLPLVEEIQVQITDLETIILEVGSAKGGSDEALEEMELRLAIGELSDEDFEKESKELKADLEQADGKIASAQTDLDAFSEALVQWVVMADEAGHMSGVSAVSAVSEPEVAAEEVVPEDVVSVELDSNPFGGEEGDPIDLASGFGEGEVAVSEAEVEIEVGDENEAAEAEERDVAAQELDPHEDSSVPGENEIDFLDGEEAIEENPVVAEDGPSVSPPKEAPDGETASVGDSAGRRALLLYQEGTAEEQIYPFTNDEICIGRGRDNEIQIKNDSKVSRKHCILFRENDAFFIKDNKSSNGSLVNGELITERRLFGGEEIIIGETFFRFRIMD